jgi:predicted acyltransferase
MSTIAAASSKAGLSETAAPRVVSIDISRGLTMALMIFVNALADVRGLPWWTYHAPTMADEMTYVDMVFPFFLFIVGMSLPLSVTQRLKRSASQRALWAHVGQRFLSLLVLGLILANAEKATPALTGMSGSVWGLCALVCAALYLNVYMPSKRWPHYSTVLRTLGLAGVVVLLALFRRTTPQGQVAWIDFRYPEILGLIAFAYLSVCILYIPTRRWRWAPLVWFALLVALCCFSTAKMLALPVHLPLYVWPFGNGSSALLVMAGVIASSIFLGEGARSNLRRTMLLAAGFALVMFAAGRLLTPLGISKNRATPTWALYCVGAGILVFALLYLACDVKQWTKWAFFVRPAGSNTLLTYLLSDLWRYSIASMGIVAYEAHFSTGWQGVVKTCLFTVLILSISGAMTKAKVRLQL